MFPIVFNMPLDLPTSQKRRGRPKGSGDKLRRKLRASKLCAGSVVVKEKPKPQGRPPKYFIKGTAYSKMLEVFEVFAPQALSDYDLEQALDLDSNSIRPTRLRLQQSGKIVPVGEKIHDDKSRPYRTYALKGSA